MFRGCVKIRVVLIVLLQLALFALGPSLQADESGISKVSFPECWKSMAQMSGNHLLFVESGRIKDKCATKTCWLLTGIALAENRASQQGIQVKLSSDFLMYRSILEDALGNLVFAMDGKREPGAKAFEETGNLHRFRFLINKYGVIPESVWKGRRFTDLDVATKNDLAAKIKLAIRNTEVEYRERLRKLGIGDEASDYGNRKVEQTRFLTHARIKINTILDSFGNDQTTGFDFGKSRLSSIMLREKILSRHPFS